MFEIPDDDDLFSEDNLKDIFDDANGEPEKNEVATHSFALRHPAAFIQEGSQNTQGTETSLGSPQMKKMRVLMDVNHQTNTPSVERHRESKTSIGPCVVGEQDPCTPVQMIQAVDTPSAVFPRRRSLRKFPGPAGILPPARPAEFSSVMRKSPDASTPQVLMEDETNRQEEAACSSQAGGEVFGGTAWQSLLSDLHPGADDVLRKFSVQAMLHKASRRLLPKGKVPLMLGVVDSMDFQGTDASVILRDPSGQMQGTLHREVLKDFSADLQPGAAIVLRQVSVISPSSRTHYLNITGGNIVAIYPASGNQTQPVLPSSLDQSTAAQSSQERMQNYIHSAEVELLEAANAAKESALNKLRRQGSVASNSPATPSSGGLHNQRSPGLFGNTPRASTPSLFAPLRPRMASSSPLPQTPSGGSFQLRNSNVMSQMRTPVPGVRTPNPGMRTPVPGVRTPNPGMRTPVPGVRTPNPGMRTPGVGNFPSSSRMQTPNRNFPQNQHTPTAASTSGSFLPRNFTPSALGGGNFSQGNGARIQPPNPSSVSGINHTFTPNSFQPRNLSANVGTPTLSRFSHATGGMTCNANTNHLRTSSEITVSSNTLQSQSQTHNFSESQASQQSQWSFKRKSTDSAGPAGPNSNTDTSSEQSQEPPAKIQHMGSSNSTWTSSSVRLGALATGSGETSELNAAAVKSCAAEKTCSMWDDDLSDDILSQLSDDF
ncbi:uncharacterized protein [Littorina saxatilis]|uniref:uncharacterized protein n=1 Tax=Littorina saxatilis TaxID=31220 RepID=UPI0038B5473D